jgi:hypothetical protein
MSYYTQENPYCRTCGFLKGFTCRCSPSFYDGGDSIETEDCEEEESTPVAPVCEGCNGDCEICGELNKEDK